jgi:hypothetical protein
MDVYGRLSEVLIALLLRELKYFKLADYSSGQQSSRGKYFRNKTSNGHAPYEVSGFNGQCTTNFLVEKGFHIS